MNQTIITMNAGFQITLISFFFFYKIILMPRLR